ncbi:GNAT family N-acetyltransferase [Brochothrix thermosphacta]|uniref:GNAT family N-acetyltransferase n=1 Tax=Brochothrix thermosphacta TaxID=2756 RepID=UPI0039AF92B3
MTIKMKPAIRKDDAIIISIWEASVRETHDFLLPGDFEEFKIQLIKYLPLLDMQLWLDDDVPIGFSAIANQKLEMFFIAPPYIGQGYGRSIMAQLFSDFAIKSVDVNEQNAAAVRFYLKQHFEVLSRDERDDGGKPYPILHLGLKA